jgi:hypothetical protein
MKNKENNYLFDTKKNYYLFDKKKVKWEHE